MAAPKLIPQSKKDSSPLARVMREFEELVLGFETGLLRSLEDSCSAPPHADPDTDTPLQPSNSTWLPEDIRHEACKLAISELSTKYVRKHIRQSLHAAESQGKLLEDQLHTTLNNSHLAEVEELNSMHRGHFRLYSTELFDMLGQPTDLRFGTLRFHKHTSMDVVDVLNSGSFLDQDTQPAWISVELALNDSFFVADSMETLPYHTFKMPTTPSLQNRGILSRRPEDNGIFPDFDSWLLFTFLGNGCIKLEVPIEMCASVYHGPLSGRDNEEIIFWGFFVDDDAESDDL